MGELKAALDRFPTWREIIWVQEEPANMGALNFIVPRLQPLALAALPRCQSRRERSPATGSHKAHVLEQQALMNDAFADFTEAGAAAKTVRGQSADGTPRPTVTLVLTAVGSEGTNNPHRGRSRFRQSLKSNIGTHRTCHRLRSNLSFPAW